MRRRQFGAVFGRERQEAELFFADLTGLAIPEPRVARPRLDSSAEIAEVSTPLRFVPIVTKWVGVDRRAIPDRAVGGGSVADPAWMGTLIDNSNLRFTGAYVTGPPLPRRPDTNFTRSSKDRARGWIDNIQTLFDQGWGT